MLVNDNRHATHFSVDFTYAITTYAECQPFDSIRIAKQLFINILNFGIMFRLAHGCSLPMLGNRIAQQDQVGSFSFILDELNISLQSLFPSLLLLFGNCKMRDQRRRATATRLNDRHYSELLTHTMEAELSTFTTRESYLFTKVGRMFHCAPCFRIRNAIALSARQAVRRPITRNSKVP